MEGVPHILVTGATSGIGLGVLRAAIAKGWKTTAINRRTDPALEGSCPQTRFEHFDVRDLESVRKFFDQAKAGNRVPDIYFLNAGVNKTDNTDGFDLNTFREVLEIDLMGVFNFIQFALPLARERAAAGHPVIFAGVSSTTNIFPNPNCLGYMISKRGLHDSFKLLDNRYRKQGIRFKSMILGPIATGIFTPTKSAHPGESPSATSKMQTKVRDFMTVPLEDSIPPIMRFLESGCQSFYYPKLSCAFFQVLRAVNSVIPLYKGG